MDTASEDDRSQLIEPFGGKLIDLHVREDASDLRQKASRLRSIRLSQREICDLELMATGAFSPVDRFMGKADVEAVIGEMRLANGHFFPMPITLDLEDGVGLGDAVALRDSRNDLLAVMTVEDVFEWDRRAFVTGVAGTDDPAHPFAAETQRWGRFMASGKLSVISLPNHYDFSGLRKTPEQTRVELLDLGFASVVAFQTRNPIHRAHEAIMKLAIERSGGSLLIHPTVGVTKPGDIDQYTRVRSYQAMANRYFDRSRTLLAVLPLAMRMAGPREALWHMIVRRNYGASHFLVGRDHASPGTDSHGKPFYSSTSAVDLAQKHSREIGVEVVDFEEMVFDAENDRYVKESDKSEEGAFFSLSGTQVRNDYLAKGVELPEWFTRPEVAELLRSAYPARNKQGFCVWLTGLSGAGKSTIADILETLLVERGRSVTLLDGDVVRLNLSKGLGFSQEDRDTNIRRIGFVAAEIVRHGGVAICAAISPYRETRNEVRTMFPAEAFFEIYVDAPVTVCEERDTKGLYAKARRGEIKGFTGVDDPYQSPIAAEVVINTTSCSAYDGALAILNRLIEDGFLQSDPW